MSKKPTRTNRLPTPPESPEAAQAVTEAVATVKAERKRRTLAQWLTLGLVVFGLLFVAVFALGRWGVLTPAGRELVSGFVNGTDVGRYGRINVHGLEGDLWNDFTLRRVTVTDRKGVWLDARDVRVDWSWWYLVVSEFKADTISARSVRLIRRPELEPQIEPPKPMPLDIDIGRFFAQVELLEGFGKEYGRWVVTGEADITRRGAKAGKLKAISLSRPGDYISADARFTPRKGPRISLIAYERQGGPLAGAMGYSPDLPFVAAVQSGAIPNQPGAGRFGAVVRTGSFTPLRGNGVWDNAEARAGGYVSFAGSDLLKPWADRLGQTASFSLNGRRTTGDRFDLAAAFRSDNLTAQARGLVNRKTWRSIGPVRTTLATGSMTRLLGRKLAGGATFAGAWTGDPDVWRLKGSAAFSNAEYGGYRMASLTGPWTSPTTAAATTSPPMSGPRAARAPALWRGSWARGPPA